MSIALRLALLALTACTVPEKLSSDGGEPPKAPDEPETYLTRVPAAFAPRANELQFAADREATFVCGLDGAVPAPCTSPVQLVVDDGPHLFSVAAVAGGVRDQTSATTTWVTDSVAPAGYFTVTPPSAVADTEARFEFAADELVTFECRLDAGADVPCESPLVLEVGEGLHSLRVTAIDRAGLRDLDPPLSVWTADTVPPEVTFLSGPDSYVRVHDASFQLQLSEPNLTLSCRLDGGAAATCSNPVIFSWVAEGAHSLAVTAVDPAGNTTQAPVVRTWVVDTTPPETTFLDPQPGSVGPTVTFDLSSTEGGVTYTCSLDAGPYEACDQHHTVTVTPGQHTIRAIARDAAGNDDPTPASHTWLAG